MSVVDASYGHGLASEERASMPFAGGMVQNGYQCGMLWGATLAAGAQAYRLLGPGPEAETGAVVAAQRLVEAFRARNKDINCSEIIKMEWKPSSQRRLVMQVLGFLMRGGPIGCFRMAAEYAPAASRAINSALSEAPVETLSPPVSCAAELARAMGESDLYTVMAAGLAGGIGLIGGACGALGAAIWIIEMRSNKEGGANTGFAAPKVEGAIERFLEASDFEFECSAIVGREFASVADHASHLRDGGCSRIIAALATE